MKAFDEATWQEARAFYIRAGGDEGQLIVETAEAWGDAIEASDKELAQAIHESFPEVDLSLWNVAMFSEVIFLLSQMWKRREEFMANLSSFEMRLLAAIIVEKTEAMQEAAAQADVLELEGAEGATQL